MILRSGSCPNLAGSCPPFANVMSQESGIGEENANNDLTKEANR